MMHIFTTNEVDRKNVKNRDKVPTASLYDVERKIQYCMWINNELIRLWLYVPGTISENDYPQVSYEDHEALDFWEQLCDIVESDGDNFLVVSAMREVLTAGRDAWMGPEPEQE